MQKFEVGSCEWLVGRDAELDTSEIFAITPGIFDSAGGRAWTFLALLGGGYTGAGVGASTLPDVRVMYVCDVVCEIVGKPARPPCEWCIPKWVDLRPQCVPLQRRKCCP
ncbi:unnamed protein product, partial [Scytosiphon promiscuus]